MLLMATCWVRVLAEASGVGVRWTIAGAKAREESRGTREQDRRLTAWHLEIDDDKCNREDTADGPSRDQVRVKACGKSARVATVTSQNRQTPVGATADRVGLLVL